MSDPERRKLTFQEKIPIIAMTSLGILAVESVGLGVYFSLDDPQVKNRSPDTLLRSVAPCASDPINFEVENKRYVVSDSRCRSEKSEDIAIFSQPNEATLGPIASVDGGTPIEATCVVEGQKISLAKKGLDSSIWIRVELDSVDGVVFYTNKSTGYVSEFDVIGDSSLPVCGINENLTV